MQAHKLRTQLAATALINGRHEPRGRTITVKVLIVSLVLAGVIVGGIVVTGYVIDLIAARMR
ncbi:hypothetical protein GCM10009624_28970 [Gordonia sinesedis]